MNSVGQQGNTQNTKKRFWRDYDPITKFNFIIALFAVVSSIATIGLYCMARSTLVVSQRAFVYAKQANIFNSPRIKTGIVRPPNTPIVVDVAFRNSGQTVSKNQSSTINFLITKDGIPFDFNFPVPLGSQPIILAPQGETHIFKAISEKDLSDIESGTMLLFVYGDVSYDDVFGVRHKTEYCFQYFGYSFKLSGEFSEYIFYTGPTHNCIDEDCKGK